MVKWRQGSQEERLCTQRHIRRPRGANRDGSLTVELGLGDVDRFPACPWAPQWFGPEAETDKVGQRLCFKRSWTEHQLTVGRAARAAL